MKSDFTENLRMQPLRFKRKDIVSQHTSETVDAPCQSKESLGYPGSKRVRARMDTESALDILEDKENFNRSRPLAPRSRPARVLHDLVVDLPTDCSDFEVSMDEEDSSPVGSIFHAQQRRMDDPNEKHYHFSVYEDPIERSN